MNPVLQHMGKYDTETQALFMELRGLILACADETAEERMWAGLPSYYVEKRFVRLLPFRGYVNIEASALANYAGALTEYKFTPKGMMKVQTGQQIPADILKTVFAETLL